MRDNIKRNKSMKKCSLLLCLLLCVGLLGLCGCEKKQDPPPDPDAELRMEQFMEGRSNGLEHVMVTMKWEKGYIASIRFVQEYDTLEHAATVYMARENELGTSGDVLLDGTVLSYNIGIGDWEGKTFDAVKEQMQKDKEWSVIYAVNGDDVIIDTYGVYNETVPEPEAADDVNDVVDVDDIEADVN